MTDTFTVYSLWRSFSGDCKELVRLSMDKHKLRLLMLDDSAKWTLPVEYTLDHHLVTGDPKRDGRVSAFREAAEFFDREADVHIDKMTCATFRRVSYKLFAWMEREIAP